jgi:hypothetical protein
MSAFPRAYPRSISFMYESVPALELLCLEPVISEIVPIRGTYRERDE